TDPTAEQSPDQSVRVTGGPQIDAGLPARLGNGVQSRRRHGSINDVDMIQLDRVTKQFAGKRSVTALDAISLTIPRGEMVSIIGKSGSGKSTFLNLVGGLDRATSGDLQVDGERLATLSDDALTKVRRDKIGFIFQFFNL